MGIRHTHVGEGCGLPLTHDHVDGTDREFPWHGHQVCNDIGSSSSHPLACMQRAE